MPKGQDIFNNIIDSSSKNRCDYAHNRCLKWQERVLYTKGLNIHKI